jgi:D-inositol-3-phosphate glycosyltransferase
MTAQPVQAAPPLRIAMISMHTSPFEQPGRANAGGLNVYVHRLAEQLAADGAEVDVFTRDGGTGAPAVVQHAPGLRALHVRGVFDTMAKDELVRAVDHFAAAVLSHPDRLRQYDVLHGHYWLAGLVGIRLRQALDIPLVQSMHTLALVKNDHRPAGQPLEPSARIRGEHRVARSADALIANTDHEARALGNDYAGDRSRITVIPPGADLGRFTPGDAAPARRELDLPADEPMVVFAGRIEPGKGLPVLLDALDLIPPQTRPLLAVIGDFTAGYDDTGELRSRLGALVESGRVRSVPPQPQSALATWFRAADLVAVPSYSESFGLVALEAQACGTPVVATRVGGLVTAVADGRSGVLVDGHEPRAWADAIGDLLGDRDRLAQLAHAGPKQAARFRWDTTAAEVRAVYRTVVAAGRRPCCACA